MGGGNDTLDGGTAASSSLGGSGEDYLFGGAGNDSMNAGDGNDYYHFTGSSEHQVAEVNDTSGYDVALFNSTIDNDTFTLFSGDQGIDLVIFGDLGGSVNGILQFNVINVNAANLNADATNAANKLEIDGNSGNNSLKGSAFDDTILAGSGNDTVSGGYGNDTLNGGAGADVFAFDALLNEFGNKDTISDFTSGTDKIQLSQNILNVLSLGGLSAADFVINTTGIAQDATDHIVYNSNTGGLYYDADGNGAGAAIQFATLTGQPALSASDFIIV